MYFIPVALFIKQFGSPAFFETIGKTASDFTHLTWGNFFLVNLLPVTIGNIIGGVVMVGVMYWFIYLSKFGKEAADQTSAAAQTASRIATATARPEAMQPVFYVTREPPTRSMENSASPARATGEEPKIGAPRP